MAFCYANDTAISGNPGIEILDVSDPANIGVIGSINFSLPPIFSHAAYCAHQGWLSPDRQYVYPADDNAHYNGLWSVYPYLPSGTIIGSDIEKGLFVWSFAAAPDPALSARNSLAMGAMLAVMTMLTLRSRIFRDRTLSATIAALVAVGLGCGSQETSDPVATPVTGSITAPDHTLPATGTAHVEYVDGLVTVRSNGSLQLAILEQLAAQAGFAIAAGRVDAKPITLQIERVALLDAIALILDGIAYTVEYDFDEVSGNRFLSLVAIGNARGYGAADSGEAAASAAQGGARGDSSGRVREAPSEELAEMLAALKNPDPETRVDAVFWIDLEGEALERLVSMLESDPDAEVRASVVDRLGDEESPAATAAVTAALRDRDPEVVLRAIEVLEFDAGDWLIPEFERLLSHPDPEVRAAAEDAILYLK